MGCSCYCRCSHALPPSCPDASRTSTRQATSACAARCGLSLYCSRIRCSSYTPRSTKKCRGRTGVTAPWPPLSLSLSLSSLSSPLALIRLLAQPKTTSRHPHLCLFPCPSLCLYPSRCGTLSLHPYSAAASARRNRQTPTRNWTVLRAASAAVLVAAVAAGGTGAGAADVACSRSASAPPVSTRGDACIHHSNVSGSETTPETVCGRSCKASLFVVVK